MKPKHPLKFFLIQIMSNFLIGLSMAFFVSCTAPSKEHVISICLFEDKGDLANPFDVILTLEDGNLFKKMKREHEREEDPVKIIYSYTRVPDPLMVKLLECKKDYTPIFIMSHCTRVLTIQTNKSTYTLNILPATFYENDKRFTVRDVSDLNEINDIFNQLSGLPEVHLENHEKRTSI